MIEREVKLSAGDAFQLPDFSGLDSVVATPRTEQHLSTLYFDSDDLRLARWGLSLRYRAGEGWTLKLPQAAGGPALVREELVFEGDPERPPAEAVDLVAGYLRGTELAPQVRLETLRRGVLLHTAQGTLVEDIVDDAVAVHDDQQVIDRFRELEVETVNGGPRRLLKDVVKRLRQAGAGPPDPTPKYARAIRGRDSSPEIARDEIARSASVGDVVTRAIGDGVVRLLRHDPVVRLDVDIEGVHQARVATRRLRSDLRTFRAFLSREWVLETRSELGWLGGELGAARDADVLRERLTARAHELPEASANGIEAMTAALDQQRRQAHARVLMALRSARYVELVDRLIATAHAPQLISGMADRSARKALPAVVRKPWHRLEHKVQSLPASPAAEDLHIVRILAKRCRYAAEACALPLGRQTYEFGAAARQLQDVLGELNDAVVAERWLRDWALGTTSPETAFAAGQLAGLERAAAMRAISRWPKAWKHVAAAAPSG